MTPQPHSSEVAATLASLTTRIIQVDPSSLQLLETNARFMRHEQFAQLVANIQRDGALTSVPLVALQPDGRYKVLSGNHRTMAAAEAGLTQISVMAIDEPLTHEQEIALQLSHNAIAGEDDPAILKALYDQLDSIDWRDYAGLDDKTLLLLDSVQPVSMSEANLNFQMLNLVFLPEELEQFEATVKLAMSLATSGDSTWIARYSSHSRLLDALADVGKSYGVMNVATGLDLILDVFDRHSADIVEGWWDAGDQTVKHKKWVPISTVTGYNAPAENLSMIKRALDKAKLGDTGMPGWKALETICADYLARAKDDKPSKKKTTVQFDDGAGA